MSRLTKRYKNGKVTLDASAFPGELQETLDSDVRTAGKPIRAAVERLAELEEKYIPKTIIEYEELGELKVGIQVFINDEECELEDLPNEYLASLEQECRHIRASNDRYYRVFERIAKNSTLEK